MRVIVYPQAKQDIDRNAIWWAENRSLDQALSWINTVELQLNELSTNPERFALARENDLFPYELRQILVELGDRRSYRAVFSVGGGAVHVLTVRRAKQDDIEAGDLPPMNQ